jgi:hypothetical protein
MNSRLSVGGSRILPSFQSAFAWSILSLLEDTKFHQINLSPSGSPPNNISVLASLASMMGSAPVLNTSICPTPYVLPETSTLPLAM